MPDLEPESHTPKPPEFEIPLSESEIEMAKEILKSCPNPEAESETEFGTKVQEALKKANPENSTLDAMEK